MNDKMIVVDGKFYKKHQIVMLTSNNKTRYRDLMIAKEDSACSFVGELAVLYNPNGQFKHLLDTVWETQYLYILSDDPIQEGDWYYCKGARTDKHGLVQATERIIEIGVNNNEEFKKVIATTDSSLNRRWEERDPSRPQMFAGFVDYIPRPSDAFVQKFVEEYNKGNVITEVLVEYELLNVEYSSDVASDGNYEGICPICKKYSHWMGTEGMRCYNHYGIKTAPDNTITIKPVVKTWDDIYSKWDTYNYQHPQISFTAWLKENYQVPKKK